MSYELRGFKFVDGMVVVIGWATHELDHGEPCWLCATMPPLEQEFMVVSRETDAARWLAEHGAEQIFVGEPGFASVCTSNNGVDT